MPRRRANDDDEAYADRHEGECQIGHVIELRESHPPGRPFEPVRGPLGFLEYHGDTLKSPHGARDFQGRKRRRKRNGKP